LFAIVVATLVHTYVIQPFQIPTSSLEKSLLVDSLCLSKSLLLRSYILTILLLIYSNLLFAYICYIIIKNQFFIHIGLRCWY
jgi:hypothetical protein